ncbi:DUF4149 domain-containing protein [Aquitalea sp. FJL05]|jgi:uncharacterized membrane protein YhaH (DUF805 family)|uniref:DUF4149 domain-containing protein n=1 Tax=Aquitalea aquatica TaxID=3044273 RepID=A0A838XWZ0_9NEIS|nr:MULTISPECIES: DUF4149 domain-containing protein [Aquitalea]MBA4706916.1 DUF4149 domain-containing protein [Aquitalea magnusonii]RQO66785.1 DUF4149 domain-containing protein [Aquitalea sp. FJL05]
MDGLRAITRTFWIGGLWVIGLIVTPVLFKMLDTVTAGMVAGKLFAGIAWVGLVCGVFLLVDNVWRNGVRGMKESSFWLIVGMLLCTVINHFAVTPIIAELKLQMNHAAEGLFGGGFATWHAISSLIYLVQSLMGLAYILRRD